MRRHHSVGAAARAGVALACLASAALCGCSALIPGSGASAPPPAQTSRIAPLVREKPYLYVGNYDGSLSKFEVYGLHGSRPIREFSRSWGVYAMAIDRWGDIYTGDGFPSGGKITAYTPGGRSVLLTIFDDFVQALAFDGSGNLYESDTSAVEEYAARSTRRIRIIKRGATGGEALAFDGSGDLYVARVFGKGSVTVFSPGADHPFRKITKGVHTPSVLMFDKSGDLFVANCPRCYSSGSGAGSITEYPPGTSTPSRTITIGIDTPAALATGRGGLLFVANDIPGEKGSVAVYGSGVKPVRVITAGVNGPDSLTVDPSGHLYVSNESWKNVHKDGIAVYTPDGARLVRKISGLKLPSAIAVGK